MYITTHGNTAGHRQINATISTDDALIPAFLTPPSHSTFAAGSLRSPCNTEPTMPSRTSARSWVHLAIRDQRTGAHFIQDRAVGGTRCRVGGRGPEISHHRGRGAPICADHSRLRDRGFRLPCLLLPAIATAEFTQYSAVSVAPLRGRATLPSCFTTASGPRGETVFCPAMWDQALPRAPENDLIRGVWVSPRLHTPRIPPSVPRTGPRGWAAEFLLQWGAGLSRLARGPSGRGGFAVISPTSAEKKGGTEMSCERDGEHGPG